MHNNQHIKAFTLVELITTTLIASLLLFVGMPAFNRFTERLTAGQRISELQQAVSYTRASAINNLQRTTMCPLDSSKRCGQDWNTELSIFLDPNENNQLDSGEHLLQQLEPTRAGNDFRSYTGSSISFDPRGFSGFHNGSLGYCFPGSKPIGAAFIISRMGRIRRGLDTDADGIEETASGQNVPCR